MNENAGLKDYSILEERINVLTHALGCLLSIVALVFLVAHAIQNGNIWHIVSFSIFGASLILLYAASTSYHNAKTAVLRRRLKIFDHAAIYVLIAGTYTPFALITLKGTTGWIIFAITWGLAATGIILKLFFTGRYKTISTVMYVLMGWVIVVAIDPLIEALPHAGLLWLFYGGIAYTLGALLYALKMIKFNHAIFHLLVLLGSFCHFMSVYFYILPLNEN